MKKGFTILEMIIVLAILGSLMLLCLQVLTRQTAHRDVIVRRDTLIREAHRALKLLSHDLEHGFVYPKDKEFFYQADQQTRKPVFFNGSNELIFFTTGYRSLEKDTPESNIAAVRYVLKRESSDSVVLRTIDPVMKEPISNADVGQTEAILHHVNRFEIELWDGGQYVKQWDSDGSDFQGLIPKMVKVTIETQFEKDPPFKLSTIVYLKQTKGLQEARPIVQEGYIWQ